MSNPGSELSRLRSLVADLDAVLWEAEASSCDFTYVSEGARTLLGYTPEEWLAEPTFWADHIHPEERRAIVGEFMRAATAGTAHDLEYRFLTAGGDYVWLRDLGHVIADEAGTPKVIRGLMVDITRSKAIEEQHKDAEARYRALVERLPAIVYIESSEEGDTPGRLLYVSPQIEDILGFTPDEWLDDPIAWAAQFHPEDKRRVREDFERLGERGEFTAEYRMYAKDGHVVWFRDDAVLVRNEDGEPLFWQGVMYDVTEERATAELVQDTEARYRSVVEQLPAIVYSEPIGPATEVRIMYISPQVEALLGVSADLWMRRPEMWMEMIHPGDRERVAEINERADRAHHPFVAEYRMVAQDGRVLWFHDEARVVRDEKGEPVQWQGVMVDITEQRRAEGLERDLIVERETAQRLREIDEMKNTFLQAVSHDLRTPLAAILGLAVTLGREDVDVSPAETRELADRIAANARKLDRMVNDLLDLDRLGRGIIEPSRKPVDVAQLVREIVDDSELLAGRTVTMETSPVVVSVDGAKVERIVENLLANTAKHTPAEARVWVRVWGEGGGAIVAVEDDGPGVSAEFREEIFEPFRRGPSASEHSPGVGVGLSLVARFAELHGGRAWVEERAGGGASFRAFLPGGVSDAEHTSGAPPQG